MFASSHKKSSTKHQTKPSGTKNNSRVNGFSLVELLIALSIAGVLLAVMFQFLISTSKGAEKIGSHSQIVTELQLAQQIISSRILEAAYLYPVGTTLKMGSGDLKKNYVTDSNRWEIGTDAIVAGFVPPAIGETEHLFFVYYILPRDIFIEKTLNDVTLDPDPKNDTKTWVLVEYRKYVEVPSSGFLDVPASDLKHGGKPQIVADFIQPVVNTDTPELDYNIFGFDTNNQTVEVNFRLLKYTRGEGICSAQRYPKVSCKNDSIINANQPLGLNVVPRNFFLGIDNGNLSIDF